MGSRHLQIFSRRNAPTRLQNLQKGLEFECALKHIVCELNHCSFLLQRTFAGVYITLLHARFRVAVRL